MEKKSELILEELKKRRRKEIVDVEEEKVKLVFFRLLDDRFAFYGSDVKEILPLANIYYVPGSPDYILGIINNRGNIESVINLNKFLGFPDSERGPASRIAIAASAGVRSGVLMDSVDDVLDVPVSSVKPPISTLEGSIRDFVAGETVYKGGSVTVLNLGRIFERMK